jgi:hypothetical protein
MKHIFIIPKIDIRSAGIRAYLSIIDNLMELDIFDIELYGHTEQLVRSEIILRDYENLAYYLNNNKSLTIKTIQKITKSNIHAIFPETIVGLPFTAEVGTQYNGNVPGLLPEISFGIEYPTYIKEFAASSCISKKTSRLFINTLDLGKKIDKKNQEIILIYEGKEPLVSDNNLYAKRELLNKIIKSKLEFEPEWFKKRIEIKDLEKKE